MKERKNHNTSDKLPALRTILFIFYCLFILSETLFFRTPSSHRIFKPQLLWALRGWAEGEWYGKPESIQYILNILFFMPYGFLFPMNDSTGFDSIKLSNISIKKSAESIRNEFKLAYRRKNLITVLSAFLLSAFIELTQYITMLGWCEIDDILGNTLGAFLGALIFRAIDKKSLELTIDEMEGKLHQE